MRRLLITICFTLAGLTACSSDMYDGAADTASAGGFESEADSGSLLDDGDTDGVDEPEPYWFVLSGELTVTKGALVGAELGFILYPEEPGSPPICAFNRSSASISPEEGSPDASIFTWASVSSSVTEDECDALVTIPEPIQLGLGAMHPDLSPALTAAGLEAGALYGAYAALGDQSGCAEGSGDACVFGYAMDQADLKGELPAASKAPMPDGVYSFEGIYAFRL